MTTKNPVSAKMLAFCRAGDIKALESSSAVVPIQSLNKEQILLETIEMVTLLWAAPKQRNRGQASRSVVS